MDNTSTPPTDERELTTQHGEENAAARSGPRSDNSRPNTAVLHTRDLLFGTDLHGGASSTQMQVVGRTEEMQARRRNVQLAVFPVRGEHKQIPEVVTAPARDRLGRVDQSETRRGATWKSRNPRGRQEGYAERSEKNIFMREKYLDEPFKRNRSSGLFGSFRSVEELLKLEVDELIMKIADSRSGFSEALETDMSPDYIVIMVKLVRKICESPFAENKLILLCKIFNSSYLSRLVVYINGLYLPDSGFRRKNKYLLEGNNMNDFWCNIIFICKEVVNLSQNLATEKLQKLITVVHTMIPNIENEHSISISDEIKEQIAVLKSRVDLIADEVKSRREINKNDDEYEEPPPNDFHDIPVYPDVSELLSNETIYLRENKTKGPYSTINDYLDIQYRLLREDFVAPLRNGIQSLLNDKNMQQKKFSDDIKVYKNVQFLNPEIINHQDCYKISFKVSGRKPVNYEHSKRFMFGSLVCFTCDKFQHILFGRIAGRDVESLQRGELIVGFEEGQNIQINYDFTYTMVECKIYFEPYYHVLSVLKNMRIDNFPMEKYIIKVETDSRPPSYLTVDTVYNIAEQEQQFNPLDLNTYQNFYNLNTSQEIAFKSALTQEFAVIQGPPGTGKTFLGLKIAGVLLENSDCWFERTPMLVICYTNHALDQFLEGLLKITSNIIRVGGQSKNELMADLNLRGKQKRNYAVFGDTRITVRNWLEKIKSITNIINEIDRNKSILDFSCFEKIIPNYSTSWFATASRTEKQEWLLGNGRDGDVRDREVFTFQQFNAQSTNTAHDGDNLNVNNKVNVEFADTEENDDEDEDIFGNITVKRRSTLFDIDSVEEMCSNARLSIAEIEKNENLDQSKDGRHNLDIRMRNYQLQALNRDLKYYTPKLVIAKRRLGLKASEEPLRTFYRSYNEANVLNLSYGARWQLYFTWLGIYRRYLIKECEEAKKGFHSAYKQLNELREMEDVRVMKDALVVGMTTTGAARLRSSLQALQSPIVIVEEAAEVLESHIVAALTPHCKHLILIGDHKQLKPSTANFKIETKFKLGISLFERMILNNIQYYTLNVQHRMRPEISKLISPMIYPELEDHESVHRRPKILGVEKPLFFIDHDKLEESCEDDSRKNIHEADFLIYLARHLILNGYKPEDITILAAYLGQMYEMKKAKREHDLLLKDVRIAVLDNYQGEESEIILLSLVRSNNESKIGFLDIDNRVCVALSRARTGFYIMGNMTHLYNSSKSGIWPKVKQTLEDQDAIGTSLLLRCQVHPDTVTEVSSYQDFFPIIEGGCSQLCNLMLACGHKCVSICHPINRDHDQYKCKEVCGRLCQFDKNHICQKMCFEECAPCCYLVKRSLKCGHTAFLKCHVDPDKAKCREVVFTKLPCGHEANKPCYCKPEYFRCPFPCEYIVDSCGHACENTCHLFYDPDHIKYTCRKPCTKYRRGCTTETEQHLCTKLCHEECLECDILVTKKLTNCSHSLEVKCSASIDDIECKNKCVRAMSCGHFCKNLCHKPCGPCEVLVKKCIPECSHVVPLLCGDEPKPELCTNKCEKKLACGHACLKMCKEECMSSFDCKEVVKCDGILSPCGHYITEIECGLLNSGIKDDNRLARFCKNPCDTILKCEHLCPGTCSGCNQGKLHMKCTAPCGAIQICNHECPSPCRKACKPCTKPCGYRCEHGKCSKRCGEPCTPCRERCSRKCMHQKCNRLCHEPCSIGPCTEPCKRKLKCRHPCIGFCGEKCPPLCRFCDQEVIENLFFTFATEDEENARFVYLEDCGHVVESEGMEQCFKLEGEEIGLKKCPLCKTPIFQTKRYSDYVKKTLKDVLFIKVKLSGTKEENESLMEELKKRVNDLRKLSGNIPRISQDLLKIGQRLVPVTKNRRQYVNKTELNGIKSKLDVIENIVTILKTKGMNVSSYTEQVNFLMDPMTAEVDQGLSDQEISDLKCELNRFLCLLQFDRLKPHLQPVASLPQDIQDSYSATDVLISSLGQFDNTKTEKVKEYLKILNKSLKYDPLSLAELRQIAGSMGSARGHWFKCPQGHYYYIGECGGAMEVGRCNECNAPIGGHSHQLLGDNQHTGDLDGSSYAAWSEQANMNNYDLRF